MADIENKPDFYIGDIPIHGRLILAPMDGLSDATFRRITRQLGSAYSVSEFINTLDFAYSKVYQRKRLFYHEEERPFVAQILDNDAGRMAENAAYIEERFKPDMIDVNLGCPARTVAGRGAGSACMKNPELVKQIFEQVCKAVSIPVTVKIRLGWDDNSMNYLEIASIAVERGAKAVAMHARTTKMAFGKTVRWEHIGILKRAMPVPVIGNGSVTTVAEAKRMFEETGCDAVMIGRAAKANPWLFSWRDREEVPMEEVFYLAQYQLRQMLEINPENAIMPFRKYLKAYLEPYNLPREEMKRLLTCSDAEQLVEMIDAVHQRLKAETESEI
ncbi:MAG: tRNA-dihydrouridine synthase family protein [Chloroflexi bacterium]|jgi:nifR3 family TIM-barrel protein|nr:tRNA-dihydrouridine synthase family protein [Chloroflexota bacterium]